MHGVSKVFHFFEKMKDPGNEFGKCVNSVIFNDYSASGFLEFLTYCESFGKEIFTVGYGNNYTMVE